MVGIAIPPLPFPKMANGIEVTPDGKTLYVVASTARELLAFSREADGGLHLAKAWSTVRSVGVGVGRGGPGESGL